MGLLNRVKPREIISQQKRSGETSAGTRPVRPLNFAAMRIPVNQTNVCCPCGKTSSARLIEYGEVGETRRSQNSCAAPVINAMRSDRFKLNGSRNYFEFEYFSWKKTAYLHVALMRFWNWFRLDIEENQEEIREVLFAMYRKFTFLRELSDRILIFSTGDSNNLTEPYKRRSKILWKLWELYELRLIVLDFDL